MNKALFETAMLYACPAWTERAKGKHWKSILSAQQSALLMVTQAYRTTSHEALQVLTGQMPLDIKLRLQASQWLISHGRTSRIPDCETEEEITESSLNQWQDRWTSSTKGRHTFKVWQDVRDRMSQRYVEVDHYVSQLCTGHGDFNAKLHEMRLKTSPTCECGEMETAEHVYPVYPKYTAARRRWMAIVDGNTRTTNYWQSAFSKRRNSEATKTYAHEIMESKRWPMRQPANELTLGPDCATSARSILGTTQ
ncbi:hypothetical protein GE061_007624 [Apolygus lucorum]|uniref:Uncharacterized protein n=1 Tax=Apolygus lucorum TaxID=248454 RepID=A0A8S9WU41_APOLU|nr:hypothetical protein GE061_007624 [Apolygus lucorum]